MSFSFEDLDIQLISILRTMLENAGLITTGSDGDFAFYTGNITETEEFFIAGFGLADMNEGDVAIAHTLTFIATPDLNEGEVDLFSELVVDADSVSIHSCATVNVAGV